MDALALSVHVIDPRPEPPWHQSVHRLKASSPSDIYAAPSRCSTPDAVLIHRLSDFVCYSVPTAIAETIRRLGRCRLAALLVCLALSACVTPGPDAVPQVKSAANPAVVLVGTFHTFWGSEPTYLLTDDTGKAMTLLLDPELTRPLGGPQAIDQRRVRIVGHMVSDAEGVLRVTSIQLDSEQP